MRRVDFRVIEDSDNSPIVPAVKRSRIRRFIELIKTIYVHIKQGTYK